jgi:uncharacterized low-complexity protein
MIYKQFLMESDLMAKTNKTLSLAIGATLAAGGALNSNAMANSQSNPFEMTELSSGYQVLVASADEASGSGAEKEAEGKCGGMKEDESKDTEGKCGGMKEGESKDAEGKCGGMKEGESKDAEGKCGGMKEGESKGAEGKCGGMKEGESKDAEGKCGEKK